MLLLGGAGLVIELLLLVYCVLNVATTPSDQVRVLPKPTWLLLVIALPLVGGIAWLVSGRPQRPDAARRVPGAPTARGSAAPTARPASARSSSPDDDEEFLRSLRRRAQEQRDRAEREQGEGPERG